MGLAIPYDDYVSKAKPWYEVLRKVAFSPFGLFVLNASYAILGAYMFIWLERPNEEKQKNLKVDKTAEVHDAVAYLKTTFWQYATNEDRFNYTKDEFFEAVSEDLATLKLFVVEYANTYGVDSIDGTVNWDWSWTFPKSLLFTITIMTTIGKRYLSSLSIKFKNPSLSILQAMGTYSLSQLLENWSASSTHLLDACSSLAFWPMSAKLCQGESSAFTG